MWDFPGPGLEPLSPALAGGFLTTAPPGKSPPPCIFENPHGIVTNMSLLLLVTLDFCTFRPPWPPSCIAGAESLSQALLFIGGLKQQEEF